MESPSPQRPTPGVADGMRAIPGQAEEVHRLKSDFPV
jgi:hypothetical protein